MFLERPPPFLGESNGKPKGKRAICWIPKIDTPKWSEPSGKHSTSPEVPLSHHRKRKLDSHWPQKVTFRTRKKRGNPAVCLFGGTLPPTDVEVQKRTFEEESRLSAGSFCTSMLAGGRVPLFPCFRETHFGTPKPILVQERHATRPVDPKNSP